MLSSPSLVIPTEFLFQDMSHSGAEYVRVSGGRCLHIPTSNSWFFFPPTMTIHWCGLCTGMKMMILCFSSSSCLPKRIVLQVCCEKTQPFFKICCFLSQVSCSSCCPWIALSASTFWVVGLEVCLHAQFVWAFVYVVQALYQLDYIPSLHDLFS